MNASSPPRRLILFAGYHPATGDVRQADVKLINELSRFGDVHCWYDNDDLSEHSRAVIGKYAASLYVAKHGEYDFGSWKYLYQKLNDYELDTYDELVMTNNSMLLLDKMDRLFEERSARAEDFFAPLMLDQDYSGSDIFIQDYEARYDKRERIVMYASIFWSMRRNLFRSHLFEDFIKSIKKEESRLDVCLKYERGFSRQLWRHNISTTTLIPRMFHHVALYTEDAFLLPSLGFPFIKYKALQQEFFDIPDIKARCEALRTRTHSDFRSILEDALSKYVTLESSDETK